MRASIFAAEIFAFFGASATAQHPPGWVTFSTSKRKGGKGGPKALSSEITQKSRRELIEAITLNLLSSITSRYLTGPNFEGL
jgi:hypothetical protein